VTGPAYRGGPLDGEPLDVTAPPGPHDAGYEVRTDDEGRIVGAVWTGADVAALYATDDAAVWAKEFIRVVESGVTPNEGLMIGWFANCAETAKALARPSPLPLEEALGQAVIALENIRAHSPCGFVLQQAEGAITNRRRLAEARDSWRCSAVAWREALLQAVEALRLTREYVGEERLPALPGWAWHDATERARELGVEE
jgi:hypothetical protein